jgi:hypothetical protein
MPKQRLVCSLYRTSIAVGLPHRPAGASVHALPRRVLHRRDGVRSVIAACRRAGTLQMLQAFQQK